MSERRRPNRLAAETSPYLLQHAHNPVDWYPWGAEALERARQLDRPILLSIGYSACHWCHVMERESFENDTIARLMNEHFVCVKVDREERPDLDELYMAATVALSGSGGWPMTVFLTPDQEPFFAGTYFPPEDRHGRPGFPALLQRVAELWQNDRATLATQAAQLTEHVRDAARPLPAAAISRDAMRQAFRALSREFDPAFGGFGRAPKFPPSAALSLLLRYHRLSADPHALEMVRRTLDAMKNGGIYDQLGGGFARYSVDARWLVPHFEKMLYDNAQLADVYLEAFSVTGDPEYRRVARETLDYVVREMQGPNGGYFSSSDADSEGEEGRYFVWRMDEVRAVLDEPLAERFCLFFGVSAEGNWEGTNVLHTPHAAHRVAKELGIEPAELLTSVEEARAILLDARQERVAPDIDDKVLTAWNGLMIRAMAHGYRQLGDRRHLHSAQRAAEFVLSKLRRPDGGLFRTARTGHAHLDGYLEDYAYFVDGLLSLYEVSGELRWLEAATELAERMVQDFAPPRDAAGELPAGESGAFFHTAHDHEALIARTREGHDGALPSPHAVACRALGRLAAHLGREDWRRVALEGALAYGRAVQRQPRAFATLLGVVDFLLEPPLEVVLARDPEEDDGEDLEQALTSLYLPNRVEARCSTATAQSPDAPPLVRGKAPLAGHAALYLCEGFTCQAPLTDPDAARDALRTADEKNRARALRELGRRRLAGRATAEGTARLAGRAELGREGYAELAAAADAPLLVSRVGFGGYRVGLDHPEHRSALQSALARGVNLFDTSPAFALGDSERLLGDCLSSAVEDGAVARDEIVIVSKLGVAQGPDRELIARRQREGRPFEPVALLGGAGDAEATAAYCLDPEFLKEQLTGSLERLGLEQLDVCLIANPEHLLFRELLDDADAAARARSQVLDALERAFRYLESEVQTGRIGAYGVSTNVAGRAASDPGGLQVVEILAAARRAGGEAHHCRVLELPLNLAETGALRGDPSALTTAREHGLAVLTTRPLNALVGDAVLRLSEPPEAAPGTPSLAEARTQVAELEAEFERVFAPALRLAGLMTNEPLLTLGGKLGQGVERAASVQQFDQIEATFVTPHVREILARLDRSITGREHDRFVLFRDRYIQAVGAWLAAVRQHAGQGNQRLLETLDSELRTHGALRLALDGDLGRAPWSQRALALLRGVDGVTSVLVGMRRRQYVSDALASLRLPVPPGVDQRLAQLTVR
jgi:uncharacterized protein YyaL (SSP411 family)/aryl-alcohol dehydrogenase-like predicted oxidoreductase